MAAIREGNIILGDVVDRLQIVCQQLKDDTPSQRNENFIEEDFWNNLTTATKLVSHEATKLCMIFSKLPLPSNTECHSLANSLEGKCLNLLSVFFKFPKSKGKTLHKDIRIFVLTVLQAIKELCIEAKEQSSGQLQSVGTVWEKCQAVESLPRDNKEAVVILCRSHLSMVEDALEELQENIENESPYSDDEIPVVPNGYNPGNEIWTDADRQLLPPSVGLIKASKACLKKSTASISARGNGSNDHLVAELDQIADIVSSSSALIDDFVLSLYPPANHSAIRRQALLVVENSKRLLSAVCGSHFCSEDDVSWIEFLKKATNHNWEKINDLVLED